MKREDEDATDSRSPKRAKMDSPVARPSASQSTAPGTTETATRAVGDASMISSTGLAPSSPLDTLTDRSKSELGADSGARGRGRGRGGRGGSGGRGRGRGGRSDKAGRHGQDGKAWRDSRSTGNDRPPAAAVDTSDAAMADGDGADGPKEPRRPKRKVALMLGYRGTDFNGLQINPGMKTIEGTVFDALVQVGCVSAENSINPNKVGLARTARTDAGVHAAINVLVIKLILDPPSLPEGVSLVDHINAALPDAIRLWSIVRVQGAFNPRKLCDARTYLYYLPTYALLPPPPGSALAAMLAGQGGDAPVRPADDAGDAFWRGVDGLTGNEAVMAAQRAWRIDPATLERMRGHARRFEGSHNFHNYSPAAKFGDRSSQRNIRSITVAEPTIAGGIEWVAIEIVGQSFMLNQIRKMVGLLALAVRTYTPSSLIPETFGPTKVHTPMAPSLGLLLDRPHFEQYNRKVAGNNSLLAAQTADEDTLREPLEYGPELVQRVDDFKRSVILERMWADEAATNTFGSWTDKFNANAGTDFKFCNSRGAVPRTDVKPAADEVEDDDARQMLAKGGRGLDELEG